MDACFLLGGMGLGVAVGLLDVFVVHLDAIKTQNHASGALDLILGIPLVVIGALLAANHLHPPGAVPSRAEEEAAAEAGKLGSPGLA